MESELSQAYYGVYCSSKEILKNNQRHLYCSVRRQFYIYIFFYEFYFLLSRLHKNFLKSAATIDFCFAYFYLHVYVHTYLFFVFVRILLNVDVGFIDKYL